MGEQNVRLNDNEAVNQAFMRSLLVEVRALERMLELGMIQSGVNCIGAEQEMFIINRAHKPAACALDILETIGDERFTHELGLFNLEANLAPHVMGGGSRWWGYCPRCRWTTWAWTPWFPPPAITP
jgi:hypothetical protein